MPINFFYINTFLNCLTSVFNEMNSLLLSRSLLNVSHLGAWPKSETAQLKGTAISQGPLREYLVCFPNLLKIADYTGYLHLMAQELRKGWTMDCSNTQNTFY